MVLILSPRGKILTRENLKPERGKRWPLLSCLEPVPHQLVSQRRPSSHSATQCLESITQHYLATDLVRVFLNGYWPSLTRTGRSIKEGDPLELDRLPVSCWSL